MNRFVLARGGHQRIPLTIVGGPEGAGKTTLLRQLLTCSDGRRIAVLLDHPSALRLDSTAISRVRGNSLELHNGSMCLALDGDIGTALLSLHATRGETLPDHVVVEAGSSASLVRMSGYSFLPGLRPGGLISVVSAPEVAKLREDGAEPDSALEAQLQQAELVVLNHTDAVKVVMRPIIRRWLQQRTTRARVIESERSCVPAAMILGASLEKAPVHAMHGEWSPGFSIETESRRNRILQPRHPEDYRAWLLTTRSSVDSSAFRTWVNSLPDSIVRGDGVLRLSNERSHRFQFHHCGLRWSLSRDEPWGEKETDPLSWISLVGFASSSSDAKGEKAHEGLKSAAMSLSSEPPHFRPPLRRPQSPREIGELS
jgi:G3E family GTPase